MQAMLHLPSTQTLGIQTDKEANHVRTPSTVASATLLAHVHPAHHSMMTENVQRSHTEQGGVRDMPNGPSQVQDSPHMGTAWHGCAVLSPHGELSAT